MTKEEVIQFLYQMADEIQSSLDKDPFPKRWWTSQKRLEALSIAISAIRYLYRSKPTGWVSVKDRPPKIVSVKRRGRNTYRQSARVLCACLQADGKQMVKEGYCEFLNDYPEPTWRIPGTIHSVTHWMELPEPPKENKQPNPGERSNI